MSDELKPCRDAFEEWWLDKYDNGAGLIPAARHYARLGYEAAWNRRNGDDDIKLKLRSPEDKEAYYLSIIADKIRLQTKHTALLDAVREVRDKLHRGGYAEHVSSRGIADTLTRIIDESEKQSVTKRVGTGSVTKTVTMTPDE